MAWHTQFEQYCAEALSGVVDQSLEDMGLRVHIFIYLYILISTVILSHTKSRSRIGRAKDGSRFCVQSPVEPW